MKVRTTFAILVLSASLVWAQSTAPQTPPAGAQGQTGAGATQSQTPVRPGSGQRMGGMQQMHQEHMQQMRQTITEMRQMLDKMKSDLAKMDAKDQPAMQDNLQMWTMLVQHLEQAVQHMSQMGQGAMGQGMRRNMRPGMRMPSSTGPTQPSTPPAEPPQ